MSLGKSFPEEMSLQAVYEPKLSLTGEERRWQAHAASDGDSSKCRQRSLCVSTDLMLVNILPWGSLSSITPIIAEASSRLCVLPV